MSGSFGADQLAPGPDRSRPVRVLKQESGGKCEDTPVYARLSTLGWPQDETRLRDYVCAIDPGGRGKAGDAGMRSLHRTMEIAVIPSKPEITVRSQTQLKTRINRLRQGEDEGILQNHLQHVPPCSTTVRVPFLSQVDTLSVERLRNEGRANCGPIEGTPSTHHR